MGHLLMLIGYAVLDNCAFKDSFLWGEKTTMLERICDIPFFFMCTPKGKRVFMPTILCLVHNHLRLRSAIPEYLNPKHVSMFLETAAKAGSRLTDKPGGEIDATTCDYIACRLRFAEEKWE